MHSVKYEGSLVPNLFATPPQAEDTRLQSRLSQSDQPEPFVVVGEDVVSWQSLAACKEFDPDQFFPPEGERQNSHSQLRRIEAAKTICSACPVKNKCLGYALKANEPYGIWGGATEDERAQMLGLPATSRPRTRPTRYPGRK